MDIVVKDIMSGEFNRVNREMASKFDNLGIYDVATFAYILTQTAFKGKDTAEINNKSMESVVTGYLARMQT